MAWISLSYLDWRWYLIFSAMPLWIVSFFSPWVPESSRYLLASGKYDESKRMLVQLARENRGTLPHGRLKSIHLEYSIKRQNAKFQKEYEENNENNSDDGTGSNRLLERSDSMMSQFETPEFSVKRGNIADVFVPAYRHTSILLLLSFFLLVFGYYGISFISERIFEAATKTDASNNDTYDEMAITTASEIPGLIIGIFFLDRIGRKKTMIYCFGIFTICCIFLLFEFVQSSDVLGIMFVFFGRMTISLAFLVAYVYFSEYYPTVIRTTALGFASSLGRVAGMITSFVSEDLSITLAMLLYGIGGLIAFICVILLKQDTTGMDMATEINKRDYFDDEVELGDVDASGYYTKMNDNKIGDNMDDMDDESTTDTKSVV